MLKKIKEYRLMRRLLPSLFVLGLCVALPVQSEGLVQIYDLAFEHDPQLKVARAQLDSTREARPQAMAQLLPTLSASGKLNRTHNNTSAGDDTYDRSELGLNLSQPIYRRDYWIELEQADRQIAQAEAEYAAAEQELMVRVSQAYFDVLTAQDTLEFARAEKAAIGRQLDQATQRFEVGLIAITAVHEAQAAFDLARADEIQAENGVDNAWEALHEIIGANADQLSPLVSNPPLNPPEPMDMAQWSETALQQNLSLIALRNATEVARQNIELQDSGHYASLDLVGSHTVARTAASGVADSDNSSIGIQLSVPLYSGGGVTSRTRQAQFDYRAAQEELDRQNRAVNRQVRDAYRGVVSSISRVKALEASTVSAQSALEATEAGFEVGTRTMVDVLDEQRNLYRARRDYSRVRYDYIMNGLRLKLAAGSIEREDLATVTGWLK
jgi:outer membrane protein